MEQQFNLSSEKQVIVNRLLYSILTLSAIVLFFKGDVNWALTAFFMAIVFEPFNPAVKFADKPVYQKAFLFTHVALEIAAFCYIFLIK